MECPKCKSDNTQRLEVIYENGTQNINTTSRSVGVGYGGGRVGVGGGSTRTSGQSQTRQAQKAAPPPNPSWGPIVFLAILGVIVTLNVWYLGLAVLGWTFYLGKKIAEAKKRFPALYQQWLDSWMCNKCGEIYTLSN